MKTTKLLQLENSVHGQLVDAVEESLRAAHRQDRDPEDGIWPELSDQLEALAMRITDMVKGEPDCGYENCQEPMIGVLAMDDGNVRVCDKHASIQQ